MNRLPTQQQLIDLLDYDPKAGLLTWKARPGAAQQWNTRYAGKAAGTRTPEGYIVVKILGRNHGAHRIIWAMIHGCWPECVDHRNGIGTDNRLRNLRAVSREINQRNQKRHSSNSTGITGVYWNRFRSVWFAAIKMQGTSYHLGNFKTKDEAARARREAENANNFTGRV